MKTFCSALFFIILINYSVHTAEIKIATYDEIKDLPNHPRKLLIDVREPHELENTGRIPTSINIPLDSLMDALKLSSRRFSGIYRRTKPGLNDEIIFTCTIGWRAQKAANLAVGLGYTNVKIYRGSWIEYATKEGLKVE